MGRLFNLGSWRLANKIIEDAEVPVEDRKTPVVPPIKTLPPPPIFNKILEEERDLQIDRLFPES